jgi:NAD(P)-dependent dehydrogenase (short-subunit alcohol dehydrogenase family)/acyl dehydratase
VTPKAPSGETVARELRFQEEDVALFAAASGDRNLLHLDAEFARSTPFGRPIVHGSLVALGLLGCLPAETLGDARWLRVWFSGAVFPGEATRVSVVSSERGWEARLAGRGKTLARVAVSTSAPPVEVADAAAGSAAMRAVPAAPDELRAGDEVAGAFRSGPELQELARRFGVEALDPALLEGLAWASYAVGMELPGLHGLFAGVTLSVVAPEPDASRHDSHSLRIRESDARTGRLLVDGVLVGSGGARAIATIESFSRRPVPRPASGTPAQVDRLERAVVVIGGSRGLGAALVLALLGQGHDVHAAYSTSGQAAAELRRLAGPNEERLLLHQADARDPAALEALVAAVRDGGVPLVGVVLSAALPPLPMGLTADSAGDLADYVAESVRLAAVPLGSLLPVLEPEGWIVFCSSVAVTAPPPDWPHYVAAKRALEGLAQWTSVVLPNARSVVVRAPKMLTDMTNSPGGGIGAASTDAVAGWIVERVVGGQLAPGLTTLEPELRELA